MSTPTIELPRDNLLRGKVSGVALRAAGENGTSTGPVMEGHFAVFNQWTEINSWEGNFLERFAPKAFKKTISENRSGMKVLFQHGYDYMIGDKPLGPITELLEDEEGVFYEVPLLDARYVREDVQPGLEAELYGASFRFRVIREEIDEEPGASAHNPNGLPERTVKEARVPEFGPVTFPAYEGASAGLRSLEIGELVAQAALERMERQDSARAHNFACRFAARDEEPEVTPSAEEDEAEVAEPETAEPEVEKTDGPDAPDTTEPEESSDEEPEDAPPQDSAETESHPDRGRRAKRKLPPWQSTGKKTPPWRSSEKEKV